VGEGEEADASSLSFSPANFPSKTLHLLNRVLRIAYGAILRAGKSWQAPLGEQNDLLPGRKWAGRV
jgi:hypothetical protein